MARKPGRTDEHLVSQTGYRRAVPSKENQVQRRLAPITGVIAAILLVAACGGSKSATPTFGVTSTAPGGPGGAGSTANAPRVVDVTMMNIKFIPSQVSAKVGETVRFVFQNQDSVTHEAVIGTAADQDAHEKEMLSMSPDMVMTDTPTAITVDAGKSGQLTYTFKTAGQLFIGCHQPGHYAAGMKITINVS